MKKLISILIFLCVVFGPNIVTADSAQAITCEQLKLALAQALSSGDMALAATYSHMSCTSGSTSSGTTLTCTQRQLNIAAALSSGDMALAAYWSAAPCVSSGSSSGGTSGGGTSSGGSTGSGSSAKPPTVVAPSCTSGPDAPSLVIKQLVNGVRFEVTPATTGQVLNDMQYEYSYYNSTTKTWGSWTGWNSVGTAAFSKTYTQPSADETKVAFGVYSRNTCGVSTIIRENSAKNGVKIINPDVNKVLFDTNIPTSVNLTAGAFEIGDSVYATLGGSIEIISQSPDICSVSGTTVSVLKAGSCKLQASSQGSETALGDKSSWSINVLPAKTTITCVKKTSKTIAIRKKITGINPKCPAGFVKS